MEVTLGKTADKPGKENYNTHFSDTSQTDHYCPIKDVIDRVSDKWSIYTIISLGRSGTLRFNELKKQIEGISQRMLTVTLRSLEEDGFISRKIYPEIPPRVEYTLTDLGKGLLEQLLSLSKWAVENMDTVILSRQQRKI
jgi:DNA-binding HxlR family transcriptional regulator